MALARRGHHTHVHTPEEERSQKNNNNATGTPCTVQQSRATSGQKLHRAGSRTRPPSQAGVIGDDDRFPAGAGAPSSHVMLSINTRTRGSPHTNTPKHTQLNSTAHGRTIHPLFCTFTSSSCSEQTNINTHRDFSFAYTSTSICCSRSMRVNVDCNLSACCLKFETWANRLGQKRKKKCSHTLTGRPPRPRRQHRTQLSTHARDSTMVPGSMRRSPRAFAHTQTHTR